MAQPDDLTFYEAFSPTERTDWIKQITLDLKGKPYEALIWKPEKGLEIAPFYQKADVSSWLPALNQAPGSSPGLRGNAWHAQEPGWQTVQAIAVDDPQSAILRLQEARLSEVHAVSLYQWEGAPSLANIREVLQHIDLKSMAVHLDFPDLAPEVQASLFDSFGQKDLLTGSMFNHPLSGLLNAQPSFPEDCWKKSGDAVRNLSASPWFRSIGIDLRPVGEAGGSVSLQIAIALAAISDAFAALPDQIPGMKPLKVSKMLAVRFSIGSSFFLEIAKLRAFRVVYDQLAAAYGIDDPSDHPPFVITDSARWNLSRYDRHTNLLRNTTEALASVIGGSQALNIYGFDQSDGPESENSARWARNIQHLLSYESYLDQVIDPAGGAYYLEVMTDQVARQSWATFQEIEAAGGLASWVFSGKLAAQLSEMGQNRNAQFAKRKKVLVGVNQYPQTGETLNTTDWKQGPFDENRIARAYETIRGKADASFYAKGKRPSALLFAFGDLAMRNARLMFTRDLLGSGGFLATENSQPNDTEASIQEAIAAAPDVLALCSSDPEYLSQGKDLLDRLAQALPNTRFVLAGKPEGWTDARTVSVFAGMDAPAFLAALVADLPTLDHSKS